MIDTIFAVKFVHVLAATVLLGTGLGIAFFMFMANRTAHSGVIALVARFVVVANAVFIVGAFVLGPLSGWALALAIGLAPLDESWIVLSIVIYAGVLLCWLPAVFAQLRMRKLARDAALGGKALPATYHRFYRVWFWLGWPALLGVLAIFVLMIFEPRLW